MLKVTPRFLAALRQPHVLYVRVEAWRGDTRIGDALQVLSGSVEAAAGPDSPPRRTLSMEVAPTKGLWDTLAPFGTTLRVWRGVRYSDGGVEGARVGTFDIDEQSLSYDPGGTMTITAPDMWVRVERAKFEDLADGYTNGNAISEALRLGNEAGLPTGKVLGRNNVRTKQQGWYVDRDKAIRALADAAGVWIYADPLGRLTCHPVPSVQQTPIWTVDASRSGVLLDASRVRNRQRTYNVVVIVADAPEGSGPFTLTVADTDPKSPTYVNGPFGRVPFFWKSHLVKSDADAAAAAKAKLRRFTGLAANLTLTAAVNPALEPGDVITVLLPARNGEQSRVERHLIDSVTIPLTAEGTQQIGTRSNRPEGDLPEEFTPDEEFFDSLVTDNE